MPYGIYQRTELSKRNMSIVQKDNPVRYWLGKKRSVEDRMKMSLARKGLIVSEETRKKISLANMGNKSRTGQKRSREEIAKMVLANTGKKRTEETKRKMSLWQKGIPHLNQRGSNHPLWGKHLSVETKRKLSESRKGKIAWNKGKKFPQISGKNHWWWKGGVTPLCNKIRSSLKYKSWEREVKNRDSYTCKRCEENRSSKITVHHVLNFSSHASLRFNLENGITLCRECHKLFHSKYGRKNNTIGQLEEFLK